LRGHPQLADRSRTRTQECSLISTRLSRVGLIKSLPFSHSSV